MKLILVYCFDNVFSQKFISMVGAAEMVTEKLAQSAYFQENENLWFHVYPGKFHTDEAYIDRIWNSLRIMWN